MEPPDHNKTVLTWVDHDGDKFWHIDVWIGDKWLDADGVGWEALHWQELPDPPKVEHGGV